MKTQTNEPETFECDVCQEVTPSSLYDIEADMCIMCANDNACGQCGRPVDSLIGMCGRCG